jgi:aspartyl-tRNA(Asn)/glutamyl-tRNA(Gln) amidotransferase subunit A
MMQSSQMGVNLMERSEIPFLTVAELSELIRSGEVSPVDVTEAYLNRVEALNNDIRAYLTVTPELARQAAREAAEEIEGGNYRGPLHGVPLSVKDQIYTEGVRTTIGTPVFDEFVPEYDATVIARLKEAGAILLGKLNMTEFATTGLSHQFDPPRNPWDRDRSCGGSSSGSGAATAAFMAAATLGEDTGGSVRFPAAWSGVAGIRPTWGLVSRYGVAPGVRSMDTVGPLAHTVEDCAIVLQVIAGHDPNDRLTRQEAPPDYRAALTGNVDGLRIGVLREALYADAVEPAVKQSILDAGNVLSKMGAEVEEVSVPIAAHAGTISSGIRVEAPTTYRDLLYNRPQDLGHDNRVGYMVNAIMPAPYYYKAIRLRTLLRAEMLEALGKYDLLISPTTGVPAQLRTPDPTITSKGEVSRTPWMFTTASSLANLPALSVPCGFSEEGLPFSLQITGRPFEEATVLRAGHAYEQATEWHTQRPPV